MAEGEAADEEADDEDEEGDDEEDEAMVRLVMEPSAPKPRLNEPHCTIESTLTSRYSASPWPIKTAHSVHTEFGSNCRRMEVPNGRNSVDDKGTTGIVTTAAAAPGSKGQPKESS